MPSPQKQVSAPKPVVESDSDSEVEGLLERTYPETSQLESMLLSEVFEFFCSLGGLLQQVEEDGGTN